MIYLKQIYKYFGILVIMVFSFYYTDKIALMVQENNPIMQQIKDIKPEKEEDYVNAIIDDDKIIQSDDYFDDEIIENTYETFSLKDLVKLTFNLIKQSPVPQENIKMAKESYYSKVKTYYKN